MDPSRTVAWQANLPVAMLLCGLLLLATVPPTVSGETVVLTRFSSGDTSAELTFADSLTNSSLGITLPRNARILSASLTAQGILSPGGEHVTRDFDTTSVGSELWALHEEATGIYPLTVDAYASGWEPIPSSQVANVSTADGKHWNTTTPTSPTGAPWEYPVQLYHFKLPVPVASAISFTFSWLGHGTCMANTTSPHWAMYYVYDFEDEEWAHYGGYTSSNAGDHDDQWMNTTFAGAVPTISANGSYEVAVVGPHADVDGANGTSDRGHLYTDYVGLSALVTAGEPKYPRDVVLGVGDADIQLSTGDLEGIVVVDDNMGLGQALRDLLDAKPPGTGNVTLDLEFSVSALTAAKVRVADLSVAYEVRDPAQNDAPVWTGPSAVYVGEDEDWTPVLDLDATFWDEEDEGMLKFAVADVSAPSALYTRVARGVLDNWTLEVRPAPDFWGDVSVKLRATDPLGAFGESTGLVVSVAPAPDAPKLLHPGELRVSERARLLVTIEAEDPDLPGDALAFSDTSALFDIDPATGVIDWTPSAGDVGEHAFNVTVTDQDGLSDSIMLRIEVVNVNDPPALTAPARADAVQGEPFSMALTADDPDLPHGDSLTFTVTCPGLEFELEPSTGQLWFTPGNDDVGVHVLEVGVRDSSGATDASTVELRVANVNDAPTIASVGSLSFRQGDAVSVRLAVADIDLGLALEVPESLTVTTDGPAWLAPTADGWVNLTVDQSMVGEHLVTYTVTDRGGLSDSVEVIWRLSDVNDAPVITTVVGATVVAREDEAFTLAMEATDLDGDALSWSDDSPLFTLGPSSGHVAFTPRQAQVGTHTVTVTVTDGRGGTASVTFQLVVENVNDAPVIASTLPADGSVFKEGGAVTLSAQAADEDGDALSYVWRDGDAVLGSGTPLVSDGLAPGVHAITLVVSDGSLEAERTFNITVEAAAGGGGDGDGLTPGQWVAVVVPLVAAGTVAVAILLTGRRRSRPGNGPA